MFERGGKKVPESDEAQVKELHAKIGELAVANDFLSRKLKPWNGFVEEPEIRVCLPARLGDRIGGKGGRRKLNRAL